ncbi:MAG: hypothetical protein Pars93KO_27380 [Parasphingorhabdus sp.]
MDIEDIYDNLPDDPQLAFAQLEGHFREEVQSKIEQSDQSNEINEYQLQYINQVTAAARALRIGQLSAYEVPFNENNIWQLYSRFRSDVENLVIQIRIHHSRRKRQFSVALEEPEKQRIRHYIEQIRQMVEESDYSQDKKDAVFKKLSELTLEIDRDRTRFEIVADGVRKLAKLSGDVEREGAEPWWKWVKLIFGVVDDAKEKETDRSLPAPEEQKKLEAPRKELPKPYSPRDMDDEIPF